MTEPNRIGGLSSTDNRARLRAVEALAQTSTPDAVSSLVGALSDPSWQVRQAAVEGLVRHGGPDAIGLVLRAMGTANQDLGALNGAMQVLARAGMDIAAALVEFLTGPDESLRACAALTLGARGDLRAAPALIAALADPDTNVRFHAIEALKELRATEAVDALAAVAESGDFFLAFPALDALANIADPRVTYRVVPLLGNELLQTAAIEALGRLGDEEAVGPLAALLNLADGPWGAVARALVALHDRYETAYRKGDYVARLAAKALNSEGEHNLVGALDDAAEADVRALTVVLGWVGPGTAESVWGRLLSRPQTRDTAIEAQVRRGPAATEFLARQLEAEDFDTRSAIVTALGRIGDVHAVPALLHVLQADDALTAEVAGSLAMIGDPRGYVPLLSLIGHRDLTVRRAVVAALNSLGHPDTTADMNRLLRDPDPRVRESAVRVAGYAGCADCTELLLERCHDDDEAVRRTAVEHLPYLDDARTLPTLGDALRDPHAPVRAAAARALGQMDGTGVVSLLRDALRDGDPWVRYFSARSVGRSGCVQLLDSLSRLAQADPAVQVRVAAVDALGLAGGPESVATLAPLAGDSNLDLARAAFRALGALAHVDAMPPLITAAGSPDAEVRKGALRALGESRLSAAAGALRQAVMDPDGDVARVAVDALGRLGTPDALDMLVELTASPRWHEVCIASLARLAPQYVSTLAHGLTHENPAVRLAVVTALARVNHPGATPLLTQAAADVDRSVRLAAITALAHAGVPDALRADSKGDR